MASLLFSTHLLPYNNMSKTKIPNQSSYVANSKEFLTHINRYGTYT